MRTIRCLIMMLLVVAVFSLSGGCPEKNEKKVTVETPNHKVEMKSTEKK